MIIYFQKVIQFVVACIRFLIAACICSSCALAQEPLTGKPTNWPNPTIQHDSVCPDISGTYRTTPSDKKTVNLSESQSLALKVFLYTFDKLNIPHWMWNETAEIEFYQKQGEGLVVTARNQNRSQELKRELAPSAMECSDGIIFLTWNYGGYTAGVSHNTISYLAMYRTESGSLVVSDNLIDNARELLIFSTKTERHDWYLYPPVK